MSDSCNINNFIIYQLLGLINENFIKNMERPERKMIKLDGMLDTGYLEVFFKKNNSLDLKDMAKKILFLPIYKYS